MNKKTIGTTIMCFFLALALASGGMLLDQYLDAKNSAETFDTLAEKVVEVTKPAVPDEETTEATEEELALQETELAQQKYSAMFEQNQDFIGWISIDGTNVNYPVMQTPNNPDYYLKHSFEKSYSDYGVPYIDEACALGISNNIVVYGHHMRNGSMFADICKYADKSFYEEHKTIKFDTLSALGEYEVVAVFKFDTNNETFKFNEYTTMDEAEFNEFMENVRSRQLYDTGVDAEYGDELLTLSTCEYTYKNGRFVVVAKKVS
jgi:sortase B